MACGEGVPRALTRVPFGHKQRGGRVGVEILSPRFQLQAALELIPGAPGELAGWRRHGARLTSAPTVAAAGPGLAGLARRGHGPGALGALLCSLGVLGRPRGRVLLPSHSEPRRPRVGESAWARCTRRPFVQPVGTFPGG